MVKCFIVIIIMWLVGNGTAINSLIQFPQKIEKKKEKKKKKKREGFAEISPKFSQST